MRSYTPFHPDSLASIKSSHWASSNAALHVYFGLESPSPNLTPHRQHRSVPFPLRMNSSQILRRENSTCLNLLESVLKTNGWFGCSSTAVIKVSSKWSFTLCPERHRSRRHLKMRTDFAAVYPAGESWVPQKHSIPFDNLLSWIEPNGHGSGQMMAEAQTKRKAKKELDYKASKL